TVNPAVAGLDTKASVPAVIVAVAGVAAAATAVATRQAVATATRVTTPPTGRACMVAPSSCGGLEHDRKRIAYPTPRVSGLRGRVNAPGRSDQAAAFSRMCTPQAEPSPMTWARPTRAPSIWRS